MRGRPKNESPCTVEGCKGIFYGKGYCRPHFIRAKNNNGDPGGAKIGAPRGRNGVKPGEKCLVEGCLVPGYTRGYCNIHYQRLRNKGELGPAVTRQKNGRNKGGRWIDGGYVILSFGYGVKIQEHRYVMEQRLGRKLLPSETVHHKNGIKTDNADSNLELWSKNHPAGQRVEDLLEWATGIIALYGDGAWKPKPK